MPQARQTFVIQLDPVDAAGPEPALRGWVEELDTGSSTRFASSTALVAFLVSALRRSGTPPAGRET
jgi:hypothetical protein